MEVKKIQNNDSWDEWLVENSCFSSFSQSSRWGKILENEGKKVERLAVLDGEEIKAECQVVYSDLFFGLKYAFCPKGPVFIDGDDEKTEVLRTLSDYFIEKKCIFLRIEPKEQIQASDFKFIFSKDINPKSTLVLDISKNEEEILQNMHSKTRYNIGLSERKGVVVKKEKDFDKFFNLMQETGQRDGFRLHDKKHYKEILEFDLSYQLNAYKDDGVVATGVFIGFGDTFTYLYGASDYEYRKLMAPNLLQWGAIKFGKELGYKYYDFFGIAPCVNCHPDFSCHPEPSCHPERSEGSKKEFEYNKDHQYAGVTRFKLGFGGEYKEDAGTVDIILNNKKYLFYKFLRKVRRMF